MLILEEEIEMCMGEYGQEMYTGSWSKKAGDHDNIILFTQLCMCCFLSVASKTPFKGSHEGRNTKGGATQRWYRSRFQMVLQRRTVIPLEGSLPFSILFHSFSSTQEKNLSWVSVCF